jgi:hypothetical protein
MTLTFTTSRRFIPTLSRHECPRHGGGERPESRGIAHIGRICHRDGEPLPIRGRGAEKKSLDMSIVLARRETADTSVRATGRANTGNAENTKSPEGTEEAESAENAGQQQRSVPASTKPH